MNRFTHQLDAISIRDNEYIPWEQLQEFLPDELISGMYKIRSGMSLDEFTSIKALICCLIAEMSDEDLLECFDI